MSTVLTTQQALDCYDQVIVPLLADVLPFVSTEAMAIAIDKYDIPFDLFQLTGETAAVLTALRVRFEVCIRSTSLPQGGPRKKCKEYALPPVEAGR